MPNSKGSVGWGFRMPPLGRAEYFGFKLIGKEYALADKAVLECLIWWFLRSRSEDKEVDARFKRLIREYQETAPSDVSLPGVKA